MTSRACERCEWWRADPIGFEPKGTCFGGPPRPAVADDQLTRAYPVTRADDWCGLFRLREAQAGGYDRRAVT